MPCDPQMVGAWWMEDAGGSDTHRWGPDSPACFRTLRVANRLQCRSPGSLIRKLSAHQCSVRLNFSMQRSTLHRMLDAAAKTLLPHFRTGFVQALDRAGEAAHSS